MRFRENWHQLAFRILTFGFIDWANSPRMLQLEIRQPWRYRLLMWPPLVVLTALYGAFVLWLYGVIKV